MERWTQYQKILLFQQLKSLVQMRLRWQGNTIHLIFVAKKRQFSNYIHFRIIWKFNWTEILESLKCIIIYFMKTRWKNNFGINYFRFLIQQQTFLREGNKMDSIDDHFLNESFPIDSSSEFATIATFLRLIQLKKCHIIIFFYMRRNEKLLN